MESIPLKGLTGLSVHYDDDGDMISSISSCPVLVGAGQARAMYGQLTSIISSMGSDQGLNPATINETETDLTRKREPLLLKTLTGALVHVHKKYFEALNSY